MARNQHLLGEISLLGLGFGGSPLSFYGTLIGGGVAGVTSIAIGQTGGMNRERWGLLAGLGTAGLLAAMKSTRPMAGGAVVGAVLASGLSWLEKVLLGTVTVPSKTVAGMGMAKIRALNGGLGLRRQADGTYLNGLGIAQVRALNGGLGLATIRPQPQSVGTIPGVHGPGFAGTQFGNAAPVSLLGRASERSTQVALLGGPPIHGLSAAYGATLLGQGR